MFLIGIVGPMGIERTTEFKTKKIRPRVKEVSKIEPIKPVDHITKEQSGFLDELAQRKYDRMRNRINVVQKHGLIDIYI